MHFSVLGFLPVLAQLAAAAPTATQNITPIGDNILSKRQDWCHEIDSKSVWVTFARTGDIRVISISDSNCSSPAADINDPSSGWYHSFSTNEGHVEFGLKDFPWTFIVDGLAPDTSSGATIKYGRYGASVADTGACYNTGTPICAVAMQAYD